MVPRKACPIWLNGTERYELPAGHGLRWCSPGPRRWAEKGERSPHPRRKAPPRRARGPALCIRWSTTYAHTRARMSGTASLAPRGAPLAAPPSDARRQGQAPGRATAPPRGSGGGRLQWQGRNAYGRGERAPESFRFPEAGKGSTNSSASPSTGHGGTHAGRARAPRRTAPGGRVALRVAHVALRAFLARAHVGGRFRVTSRVTRHVTRHATRHATGRRYVLEGERSRPYPKPVARA